MIESNRFTGIFIHGKCSEDRIYSTKPSFFTTSMAILMAIIINGMLLTGVSLINKGKPHPPDIKPIESLILYKYHPPELSPIPADNKKPDLPPRPIDASIERTKPIYVPNAPPTSVLDNLSNTIAVRGLRTRPYMPPETHKGPVTLSEVDIHPQLIRHIQPFYPFSAKRKNIEGQVTVRFVVDQTGMVLNPVVIKATPEGVFEESALNAVARWRFKPAMLNKKPVDVYVVVPVTFELN